MAPITPDPLLILEERTVAVNGHPDARGPVAGDCGSDDISTCALIAALIAALMTSLLAL